MTYSLFFLALPPPVTGQSVINKSVVDRCSHSSGNSLKVFNIAPTSLRRGLSYHVTRIFRVIYAALGLIFYATRGWVVFKKESHVYFVYEAGLGIFYNCLIAVVARLSFCDIFVHHHTAAHSLNYSYSFDLFSKILGPGATHILLTPGMLVDLKSRYDGVDLAISSSNAVHIETQRFIEKRDILFEEISFGFLSNLSVEKGALVAFACFESLVAEYPVRLEIAGPVCDEKTNNALTRLLNLYPNSVNYWGAVYSNQKATFFESIDAFVFPTLYKNEAQPLVVFEALSYGKPVFAFEKGYINEMVPSSAFLFGNQDSLLDSLKKNIKSWLDSPSDYFDSALASQDFFVKKKKEAEQEFLFFEKNLMANI